VTEVDNKCSSVNRSSQAKEDKKGDKVRCAALMATMAMAMMAMLMITMMAMLMITSYYKNENGRLVVQAASTFLQNLWSSVAVKGSERE
jgi:hypothetical protein